MISADSNLWATILLALAAGLIIWGATAGVTMMTLFVWAFIVLAIIITVWALAVRLYRRLVLGKRRRK